MATGEERDRFETRYVLSSDPAYSTPRQVVVAGRLALSLDASSTGLAFRVDNRTAQSMTTTVARARPDC